MDDLQTLRARMLQLVQKREVRVSRATEEIKQANREFDREAIKLAKKIRELETNSKPTPRPRKERELVLDGLDEDERRHYMELLRK